MGRTDFLQKKRRLSDKARWLLLVANRFARVDRLGRSAVTSFLATAGICFGVMALIVVVSVMNGFQMTFKDAIMELSSYHLRVTKVSAADSAAFLRFCENLDEVVSVTPFLEAQGLMAGGTGTQSAALIRAVPSDVCEKDKGFARELNVFAGEFDLRSPRGLVLGSGLARSLSVRLGDSVNLLALSGGSDVALLSKDRNYVVTGVFHSGYSDLNDGYAFISEAAGAEEFGRGAETVFGVKVRNENSDRRLRGVSAKISAEFPGAAVQSWQSYNRSFFGVLRIEKNILLIFVFLIFVVVAINIYNGMNRLVFERRAEISIFSALGATAREIEWLFVLRGFLTGAVGSLSGLLLGLFLSINSAAVFRLSSAVIYWAQYFLLMLTSPERAFYLQENPMYQIYASIPARALPAEIFLITLFGFFAPLLASFWASRKVVSMNISEVLHDE